ncbi:MAG: winged helix-turn-helix transcriptional regulator [Candidatus Methanoperedens sp.]|nr:winged helix-turn-helix transcriptional regulator [Candidatus Methanoperedens sp.]
MMEIDELTRWVLSVDRRALVMREVHENELIKASEIAEKTGRSLQNISRAMRELEELGLIECLTPEKHTWKRFILTGKGAGVFEKLKACHLINQTRLR